MNTKSTNSPINKKGELTDSAIELCLSFNKEPCMLFENYESLTDIEHYDGDVPLLDTDTNHTLYNRKSDPVLNYEKQQLNQLVDEALKTLGEREISILRLRFGFDGLKKTLDEVSEIFSVTRERIRQIEAKALRKLRNPSRTGMINEFLNSQKQEKILTGFENTSFYFNPNQDSNPFKKSATEEQKRVLELKAAQNQFEKNLEAEKELARIRYAYRYYIDNNMEVIC
jgi:RNA polymerase sigma factor (sigma-70 family)